MSIELHEHAVRPGRNVRLDTLVRLRWVAVIGQTTAVLVVYIGLDFELPIWACLAVIALAAWLNVALRVRFRVTQRVEPDRAAWLLAFDIAEIAILLFLTGGLQNPFAFLLLGPVLLSATALPPRMIVILGGFAAACATVLVFYHYPLPWDPDEPLELPAIYIMGVWLSLLLALGFIGVHAWQLAEEERQLADALAATELVLAREQHLSQLDGLAAAAAHELGTPLSTITVIATDLERAIEPDSPVRRRHQAVARAGAALPRRSSPSSPSCRRTSSRSRACRCRRCSRRWWRRIAISASTSTSRSTRGRHRADRRPQPGDPLRARQSGGERRRLRARARRRGGELERRGGRRRPSRTTGRASRPRSWTGSASPTSPARGGGGSTSAARPAAGSVSASSSPRRSWSAPERRSTYENRTFPERGAVVRVRWGRSDFEADAAAARSRLDPGVAVGETTAIKSTCYAIVMARCRRNCGSTKFGRSTDATPAVPNLMRASFPAAGEAT